MLPNTLQLKQIDQNNRGLFSTVELKPWSTVLQLQPICTSLSINHRSSFCSNCLLRKQVSRCSQCKVPYYCSKQCQKQDWKIHKKQCPYLTKLRTKTDPSKLTMQILLNLRLWVLQHNDQQIQKQIEEMCCLIDFQTPQKLSQFQQTAVALLSVLQVQRNQENMSELVKQQSRVSLNCFTIQDYLCNQEAIGLGIYLPANFINHHCHPNCCQIFDGRDLKIVPTRTIQKGEEITISYMPVLESWKKKKKMCREGYLFQCFCEECQANSMFNQDILYLKCPFCGEQGLREKKVNNTNQDEEMEQNIKKQETHKICRCEFCKKQVPAAQIESIIESGNKELQTIEKQSNYPKILKALLNLKKIISFNDPRVESCIQKVYSQSLVQAQENPSLFKESYTLMKEMVELMPKWYRLGPEDSIPYVYVWRFAELGKLAYNLQKFKKACQCTEKAYQIIEKIKFKNDLQEVSELKQRYNEMKIGLSFNKAEINRKNG